MPSRENKKYLIHEINVMGACSSLPMIYTPVFIEGKLFPTHLRVMHSVKAVVSWRKTEETAGMNPENETIASILSAAETIAVVGLSDDPSRASHRIAAYLQEAGYRVIPVNPRIESALGEKAYPSLVEIKERVDIVNAVQAFSGNTLPCGRDYPTTPARVLDAKGHLASRLRARRLKDAGITAIQNLCIKTAHREFAQTPR